MIFIISTIRTRRIYSLFARARARAHTHTANKSSELLIYRPNYFSVGSDTNPLTLMVALKKFNLKTRRYLLHRVVNTVYGWSIPELI